MKKLQLIACLTLFVALFSTCSKDDDDKTETTAKVGNLKVATYYYHPSAATSSYILRGGIKVELMQNGLVIATQYSPGIGTLDFGDYAYGTYTVRATAEEGVSTPQGTSHNADFDETFLFNIESPTRTITFDFP